MHHILLVFCWRKIFWSISVNKQFVIFDILLEPDVVTDLVLY